MRMKCMGMKEPNKQMVEYLHEAKVSGQIFI